MVPGLARRMQQAEMFFWTDDEAPNYYKSGEESVRHEGVSQGGSYWETEGQERPGEQPVLPNPSEM